MKKTTPARTPRKASNRKGPRRLIPHREVLARIPIGRVTLWRLVKNGHFPKPVSLTPGKLTWLESDIDDWIDALAAESREADALVR